MILWASRRRGLHPLLGDGRIKVLNRTEDERGQCQGLSGASPSLLKGNQETPTNLQVPDSLTGRFFAPIPDDDVEGSPLTDGQGVRCYYCWCGRRV